MRNEASSNRSDSACVCSSRALARSARPPIPGSRTAAPGAGPGSPGALSRQTVDLGSVLGLLLLDIAELVALLGRGASRERHHDDRHQGEEHGEAGVRPQSGADSASRAILGNTSPMRNRSHTDPATGLVRPQIRRKRRRPTKAPIMPITHSDDQDDERDERGVGRGDEEVAEEAAAVGKGLVESEVLETLPPQ